ncbi:hypothetical protein JCM11491_005948 [Sporobolomyces phaffii]
MSLQGSLSYELVLRCLSFLAARDLVTLARVSHAWSRLADDPHLWRDLYLDTYASPRDRDQFGSKRRPWKDLYKVSTNWRTGHARSSTTTLIRHAVLASPPVVAPPRPRPQRRTLLEIHRHFFFSTSSTCTVSVSKTSASDGEAHFVTSFSSPRLAAELRPPRDVDVENVSITELRLDAATDPDSDEVDLAVFYSTGHLSIFRISLLATRVDAREVSFSSAPSSEEDDPVEIARYDHPLLVTCSRSFTLRFYHVAASARGGGGALTVTEAETPLKSSERWSPVVLSLERLASNERSSLSFRVSIAYALPRLWSSSDQTVGLQEFIVNLKEQREIGGATVEGLARRRRRFVGNDPDPSSPPPPPRPVPRPPQVDEASVVVAIDVKTLPRTVSSSSSALAALGSRRPLPRSSTWTPRRRTTTTSAVDEQQQQEEEEQDGGGDVGVTGIEYSHPFIVTANSDNTLSVYRVVSVPNSVGKQREREIRFETTLFGHTARVGAVALHQQQQPPPPPRATADQLERVRGGGGGNRSWRSTTTAEEVDTVPKPPPLTTKTTRVVSAGDDGSFKVWSFRHDDANDNDSRRHQHQQQQQQQQEVVEIVSTPIISRTPPPRLRRRREGPEEEEQEEAEDEEDRHRPSRRRRRRQDSDDDDNDGQTVWQRLKRGRTSSDREQRHDADDDRGGPATTTTSLNRPERVGRLWVDHDKIVMVRAPPAPPPHHHHHSTTISASAAAAGGEQAETIRILRFD